MFEAIRLREGDKRDGVSLTDIAEQSIAFLQAYVVVAGRHREHAANPGFLGNDPDVIIAWSRLLRPSIVLIAFAAELALKALCVEAGIIKPGHELDKIADRLGGEVKGRLAQRMALDLKAFDAALKAYAETFVRWRYAHEYGSLSADTGFLENLTRACLAELGLDQGRFAVERLD